MATQKMAVTSYDTLYQLTTKGRIKRFQGAYDPKPWLTIDNNQAISDIVCGDHLYQLLTDGCVERFNGPNPKDWTPLDEKADYPKKLVAGGETLLRQNMKTYAVDIWEDGNVWHSRHFNALKRTHSDDSTTTSKLVAVTPNGVFVAFRTPEDSNEKFVIRWTRWEPSGGYNRYFWQLGGSDLKKELDSPEWLIAYKDIVYFGNRTKILSIDRTHKDDFQRVYTGTADSPLEQVAVGKAGLFRLHQDGKIYKRTVLYSHWMLINDQKTNIEIVVGKTKIYRRTIDNGIFEWNPQFLSWTAIQPEIGDEDD